MIKKYYAVFGPALRIMDALILAVCWIAAYYLRTNFPLPMMRRDLPSFVEYWPYIIVIILLWSTVFSFSGLYSSRKLSRRTIEAYQVLKSHGISLIAFISLTYLVSTYKLSRGVFLYFGFMSAILLVECRVIFRNIIRKLRARGYNIQRIAIIGTGSAAELAYQKLTRHPELGIEVIGFFGAPNPSLTSAPILGDWQQATKKIQELGINKLIIALPRQEAGLLESILQEIKDDIVDVVLIPDIYEYVSLTCEVEDFDGLPLVSLNETPIMGVNVVLKRVFDVLIASIALLVFSPIMLLVAIIVKLSSKGPVFYKQERMSLNGKSFNMLKFRSMSIDQAGDVEVLTKKNDPRLTAVGEFIRKTSLDELPQFFNVLMGQMSVVGPRPERTWVVDQVRTKVPRYMLKHKVKAGITGWAQVNGWRGDTSLEKRVEYDLYYIKNWTFLFDIKILLLTVFKGFINRNAY